MKKILEILHGLSFICGSVFANTFRIFQLLDTCFLSSTVFCNFVSKEANMPLKVLIVDDEDALRYSLKRALSNRAFEIFEADSGEVAIKVAQKEMPNIVLWIIA